MVQVDDSTDVLLVTSVIILVAALLPFVLTLLSVLLPPRCIPFMERLLRYAGGRKNNFLFFSVFLTAVALQWWNLNTEFAGGTVGQTAFVFLFMVFGTIAVYIAIDNINVTILALMFGGLAIVALVWGQQRTTDWMQAELGIDLPLIAYYISVVALCAVLALLIVWVHDRVWIRRFVEFVIVTFVCAWAVVVIIERNPLNGFADTDVTVFDVNALFIGVWIAVFVLYVAFYWYAYHSVPWFPDKDEDNMHAAWKQHKHDNPFFPPRPKHVTFSTELGHDPTIQALLYSDIDTDSGATASAF